jgi:regulator of protease activity HflC (stomatin/prohibitin superfamily)
MAAIKTVFSQHTLTELLVNRQKIQKVLAELVDKRTDPYGIKVERVGIQSLKLPANLESDLSVVAESKRRAEANIINSIAGFESAKLFTDSAEEYAKNPVSFQLMYFEVLKDLAVQQESKIVLPASIIGSIRDYELNH